MTNNFLQVNWPVQATDKVVLGVSGGVDSLVLLALAVRDLGVSRVIVAHVNYHLRPESDGDAQFVREMAARFGVPFFQHNWWPNAAQTNLEATAREVRYAFFDQIAMDVGAKFVAVGHHQDDALETAFWQITRSGELEQAQLQAQRPLTQATLIRPLLHVNKAALIDYAQAHDLTWREDSTNAQVDYTPRNRLRHDVLPALTDLNTGARAHWHAFFDQMTTQQALIDEQANRYVTQLTRGEWRQIPTNWLPPTIKSWLKRQNHPPKTAQIQQIVQLLTNENKPQGQYYLDENTRVKRRYDELLLENVKKGQKSQHPENFVVKLNHWQSMGTVTFYLATQPSTQNTLAVPANQLPLTIRPVQSTDELAVGNGKQPIRRTLINEKVLNDERQTAFVVVDRDNQVRALFWESGYKVAAQQAFVQQNQSETVYLHWQNKENSMNNDIQEVLFDQTAIQEAAARLGAQITTDYAGSKPLFLSVLKGAYLWTADLLRAVDLYVELEFINVSSYHGGVASTDDITLVTDMTSDVAGRDVIILEDIVDTGQSLKYLVALLAERGAKSIKVATLLDKKEGRKVEIKADYVGFDVRNEFVVGYGLDYKEMYRNLPYVGILKPSVYEN
jgi:bifunctional protein TilS/HprT